MRKQTREQLQQVGQVLIPLSVPFAIGAFAEPASGFAPAYLGASLVILAIGLWLLFWPFRSAAQDRLKEYGIMLPDSYQQGVVQERRHKAAQRTIHLFLLMTAGYLMLAIPSTLMSAPFKAILFVVLVYAWLFWGMVKNIKPIFLRIQADLRYKFMVTKGRRK